MRGSGSILGRGSSLEGGQALEKAPLGSGHGTKRVRAQEASGQSSQTYSLISVWSFVEPVVGLDDRH